MINRQLVFPCGVWQDCERLLFGCTGDETFLMGLARPCRRHSGIAYIVEQLLPEQIGDYMHRSRAGLALTDQASGQMNLAALRAAESRLVPVHLHSHPPGVLSFSHCDDVHERQLHEWLSERGQPMLWSLVWPAGGQPTARLWVRGGMEPGIVRAGLQPFGSGPSDALPALDRQKVFGAGLRRAAGLLRVGIVGLGGIGFPVAEQLSRCGFSSFLLIDPDRVDVTNLNRLPGTRVTDIGQRKVDVAKRIIHQAAKCIGVKPTVNARASDIYVASGQVRSELRQCDLILALTDDELSRLTCLQISLEGGAEYLQAGVDIRLGDDAKIVGLFAEVTGAEVNRYCPICTGRLDPGQGSIEARKYVGGYIWKRAQEDGYVPGVPAPAVMSLNAIAAGMLVMEIQRRVSGLGVRDLLQVDLHTGSIQGYEQIDQQLEGECSVCGRGEGVDSAKDDADLSFASARENE